jgi:hypothetical protein
MALDVAGKRFFIEASVFKESDLKSFKKLF